MGTIGTYIRILSLKVVKPIIVRKIKGLTQKLLLLPIYIENILYNFVYNEKILIVLLFLLFLMNIVGFGYSFKVYINLVAEMSWTLKILTYVVYIIGYILISSFLSCLMIGIYVFLGDLYRKIYIKLPIFVIFKLMNSSKAFVKNYGFSCFMNIKNPAIKLELANRIDTTDILPLFVFQIFLKEGNAEVRRVLIRKIGIAKFLKIVMIVTGFPHRIIDNWNEYQLIEVFIPLDLERIQTRLEHLEEIEYYKEYDDEEYHEYLEDFKKLEIFENYMWVRYLKMKNPSTGEYHIEGVPPSINTCKEALSWRIGGLEWNPVEIT